MTGAKEPIQTGHTTIEGQFMRILTLYEANHRFHLCGHVRLRANEQTQKHEAV
jgi:hypothetical protein